MQLCVGSKPASNLNAVRHCNDCDVLAFWLAERELQHSRFGSLFGVLFGVCRCYA
jgi:hypothetical protein